MEKFEDIIKSFSVRDTLNPKVWENPEDVEKAKMKPKVRKALDKIADKFIEYLGENVMVEDVVLTGSLSNFNWSDFSDFDLHVIIDFQQYENEAELYKELYNLKKQLFNEKYNIKIFGYDVELYAQDIEESHFASGTYSIMNDEWIKKPKKENPDIDKSLLINKIRQWVEKIDRVTKEEELDGKKLESIKTKLKEYRQSGLEKNGELSYENLVFKFLRRSGHIEKLFDALNKSVEKELSVERKINEVSSSNKLVGGKKINFPTTGETKDNLEEQLPEEDKTEEKINVLNSSKFLQSMRDLAENGKTFEYSPGMKIPYIREVELIQTALQFLGFSLPKWGVDGKFGPETETATKKFQEKFGITPNGTITKKELEYLTVLLVIAGFQDSDLQSIKKEKEIDVTNLTDRNFYERLLQELGAPLSDENMKFLFAWRQSEGKAGKFNPFNTTHRMPNSTNFNKVGVKNYATLEDGLVATLKTLRNGRYECIVRGLKNDIGANKIAECPSLKTWGTGDLVAKVVRGYESGSSPKVASLA